MKSVIHFTNIALGEHCLPINANDKLGCYTEILKATQQQFDAMLSHHARVLFVRMDIRVPCYSPDNRPIANFMRRLIKRVKKKYKMLRVAYLWAREKNKSEKQHYHIWLMLDGSKIQHPKQLIQIIEEIAESYDWPKPYTPKNCFTYFHRTNEEAYKKAFYRASYLAKVNTKQGRATNANDYSASRIKPKFSP